jgi:hypothetical protein
MYRRRRAPDREPVFGFDSFLDLVTNVLGIIIRLILVAWVGGRAYSTFVNHEVEETPAVAEVPPPRASDDPLNPELAKTQLELAQARARLLEQIKQLHDLEESKTKADQELIILLGERNNIEAKKGQLDKSLSDQFRLVQLADLSLAELRERSQKVLEQIKAVEKQPTNKKTFRYHSPVSRAVHSEELMFECQHGRVTFIDVSALADEAKRCAERQVEQLRTRWEISDTVGPVGAFRLRYKLARQRDVLSGAASPYANEAFHADLSWILEPITNQRGESGERALAPGSEFRQVIQGQDLRNTVITFWVYPDSFPLFRQLRDYLYEQGAEVAARPIPDGAPIGASRNGTASRGQ